MCAQQLANLLQAEIELVIISHLNVVWSHNKYTHYAYHVMEW